LAEPHRFVSIFPEEAMHAWSTAGSLARTSAGFTGPCEQAGAEADGAGGTLADAAVLGS
jgi:hypothetical protein